MSRSSSSIGKALWASLYCTELETRDTPSSFGTVGFEFPVSTFTQGFQMFSAVALDADGDCVVVWQSKEQDGDGEGVYGQRYNSAGTPQGEEFLVNTVTVSHQDGPAVAMDANGNFVIAWQSYEQDGSGWGVYARRYNAAGTPQGGEFLVNTFTEHYQSAPAVAMDA